MLKSDLQRTYLPVAGGYGDAGTYSWIKWNFNPLKLTKVFDPAGLISISGKYGIIQKAGWYKVTNAVSVNSGLVSGVMTNLTPVGESARYLDSIITGPASNYQTATAVSIAYLNVGDKLEFGCYSDGAGSYNVKQLKWLIEYLGGVLRNTLKRYFAYLLYSKKRRICKC